MQHRNIKLDTNGVRVVKFFMEHPERELTADEISKTLKMDEIDAGIILNVLERAGFLEGKGKGLTYQYKVSEKVLATKINTDHARNDGSDTTRYIG